MIRFEFEPPSLDRLGDEALELLHPRAHAAAKDVGKRMVSAFKKEVGRKGVGEVASRPGEPPMVETREYQRAFGRRIVNKKKKGYVEVQLGNRLWHTLGRWLNYGTQFMLPRPHIEPVIEREKAAIEERLSQI